MSEILRPRSLGELFGQTFSLIYKNLPTLIAIQAIVWLPFSLINHVVAVRFQDALIETERFGRIELDPKTILALVLGAFNVLILLIIKPVSDAASMLVIADHFMGRRTSLGTAFAVAFRKLVPLLAAAILVNLPAFLSVMVGFAGLFAAFLVLGLGGILVGILAVGGSLVLFVWICITFSVAAPAVVLENLGALAALERSLSLTRGCRWNIFCLAAAAWVILLAITAAITAIAALIALTTGTLLGSGVSMDPLNWGLETVNQMIQLMVISTGIVVVYFDLRVRKDGFDLDNLAELVDVIAQRSALRGRDAAGIDSAYEDSARIDDEYGTGKDA